MPKCTRKGCGANYAIGDDGACIYHPGTPVFHEGLKSWSCCQDINKPTLDFDEFIQISGCTEIKSHIQESPEIVKPAEHSRNVTKTTVNQETVNGEFFTVGLIDEGVPAKNHSTTLPTIELDDLNKPVAVGSPCLRKGCKTAFIGDEVNRQGDGEGTICRFHPLPPHFREGSKGYLCCKRRVLEFEEFLKIEGCQTGRHCFVPVVSEIQKDEQVKCRIDHYQTPQHVYVSVFAKKVDKGMSSVHFESSRITLDLFLPNQKIFSRSLNLFGSIDPNLSKFEILSTKVELQLRKSDARSWTVLEKPEKDLGNVSLTFGVGGRTGTVGSKDIILENCVDLQLS